MVDRSKRAGKGRGRGRGRVPETRGGVDSDSDSEEAEAKQKVDAKRAAQQKLIEDMMAMQVSCIYHIYTA